MNTVSIKQSKAENLYSGRELREMFCLATQLLEKNASAINALNVFPVPDGDTGTNMLLTMRSTMSEAAHPSDNSVSAVAEAMAHGALMGARGNSGVILSQIMGGIADGLRGQETFGTDELALALNYASEAAYRGISKPREGTMLTVINDVAIAAKNNAGKHNKDLIALMGILVDEAKRSVQRTPELLDVLKEAGVVDSGGQGIYVILKGILHYLRGETYQIDDTSQEFIEPRQPAYIAARAQTKTTEAYGFCTEVIIKGNDLDQKQIKQKIESYGNSVLVVGDSQTIKVHVHTCHPGEVIEFGISQGSVHDIKIQNMDDQHEEFVHMRRTPVPLGKVGVIAVAAGSGLEEVFNSLGVATTIPGGQTMNPSCSDILQAIDSVPFSNVIVLPNNKNIIPVAKQAANLAKKKVKVLPTRSIPQGISALIVFNGEMELDLNMNEMARAIESVRSIEITRSVRDANVGKVKARKGDYIGLLNGNIVIASHNRCQAVLKAFGSADAEHAEIASIFYSQEIENKELEKINQALKQKYHDLEIELVAGGQPHYDYIVSIE
ncbi:MAG TPA: DAK2 domain-containing protein [Dehalococcoidia bacterium]|nr:DAK2 domain-containing protein [Dehalococcoidia bacterium]